ncbi:hypothetical protein TcasGA2_TC001342 [Tribolium castaneum]|uniref:Uncharacterized protein n=1 Tax=Tribolium castaneum TaxID=7070 RepID=D6WC88_TRICA|nr:hypothetical protein TcasGA2_TC001342 [Tribolium castaneum]
MPPGAHISTLSRRVYIYTSTVTEINQSGCACIDSRGIRANLSEPKTDLIAVCIQTEGMDTNVYADFTREINLH